MTDGTKQRLNVTTQITLTLLELSIAAWLYLAGLCLGALTSRSARWAADKNKEL
jgi:hypothetical protein